MQRFCFSTELRNDQESIERYIEHHRAVWPEILESLHAAGVEHMEIYRLGERLFMIMDTTDDFSLERKAAMDLSNPKVQEWEWLMETFQRVDSNAGWSEKWRRMERVFELPAQES